jgi:hypothetical protein
MRKVKKKTRSLLMAELKHDKWLRQMGVHPDQISKSVQEYRNRPLVKSEEIVETYRSSNNIAGVAAKKDKNVYSGSRKLLGIAAMHKSNLVPVFDKSDAKEIAKMRRG